TDQGNSRVQKFDREGNFMTKWGSKGSGEGQFIDPLGIALDTSGNVYVVDAGNRRVQVFAPS
ncbi:MAG: 6-bladed beta-propeller, partial [Nitrososphaeraceae archaeon]